MSINSVILHHYRSKVNEAVTDLKSYIAKPVPREGWIRTVRKALGMSGTQLAKNLGVTKGRISAAEKDEVRGAVTLKSMHAMAEAMDCTFVYAVVPKANVEEVIWQRALAKARKEVASVSVQMALEGQALSPGQLAFEEERVAREIAAKLPSDFWKDD